MRARVSGLAGRCLFVGKTASKLRQAPFAACFQHPEAAASAPRQLGRNKLRKIERGTAGKVVRPIDEIVVVRLVGVVPDQRRINGAIDRRPDPDLGRIGCG